MSSLLKFSMSTVHDCKREITNFIYLYLVYELFKETIIIGQHSDNTSTADSRDTAC